MSELNQIMTALDAVEKNLEKFSTKADLEVKLGEISIETKNALEQIGIKQRELADDLLLLQQKSPNLTDPGKVSIGAEFTKSADYAEFVSKGAKGRATFETKNTITNTVGATFSDRQLGIAGGAFRQLSLLNLLTVVPTTQNSIDYTRENVFTNNAAETTEGNVKPESSITFTPVNTPIQTIAHFVKISKQLASDNAALTAYIDTRMTYGVQLRLENQIIQGNGTTPNISGFTAAGNFTAHGYTAANLTSAGLLNNRFDVIGKIIGDTQAADYPADVIIVNPTDWWTMRLAKDSQNRYLLGDPGAAVPPNLFGLTVVPSNAVVAGNVLIASLAQAAVFYQREGVVIDMSDSDGDNFQRNLITVRAEMRGALAVERPAAVRYGALVPA